MQRIITGQQTLILLKLLQREHSAILSSFHKLPFVIKIFVLSIFEWPFYTGFTVSYKLGYEVFFNVQMLCVQAAKADETVWMPQQSSVGPCVEI